MTKIDKLIKRLLSNPKDMSWQELVKILTHFGFILQKTGKTGGSRRRFESAQGIEITLHEPHKPNILKPYQINQIIEILKKENLL